MTYINHWEDRGLYRKFSDTISGKEVLESNFALQGDPRFDEIRYIINDFREITDFEVSYTDINVISAVDTAASLTNPNIKIAMIASLEPLLVWIKLYCDIMEDSPYICKIFDDMNAARQWLPPTHSP